MDELTKTMNHASNPTNIMEYVRQLEGIIKHERETRDQHIKEEVAFKTALTRFKWMLYGFTLGCLPWILRILVLETRPL